MPMNWRNGVAGVRFRPIDHGDREFLSRLYASTRTKELSQTGWDEAEKARFLGLQFDAQHQYYRQQFPRAEFLLIEDDSGPIGRLYLDTRDEELRLIDIALIPDRRGAGTGSALMRALLEEADRLGLPTRIHVEKFNPALRLYGRLGFSVLEDKEIYLFMERRPGPPDAFRPK